MKKFRKQEIIALSVIGALMVATIVIGVILITGNANKVNNSLQPSTSSSEELAQYEGMVAHKNETQPQQEEGTEATAETSVEKETATTKAEENKNTATSKTNKNNKKPTKNNSADKTPTATKKPNNSSNSDNSDKIPQVKPETKPVDKNEDVLKINGVKCNVGNTITVTLDFKTPKVLENFQGYTEYDTGVLQFVSIKGNVNGMFNEKDGVIYYNGSDIMTGYDFTSKGTMYTATFKVLKSGTTELENTVEVMSDQTSKAVSPKDCQIGFGIFN